MTISKKGITLQGAPRASTEIAPQDRHAGGTAGQDGEIL